jgi:phosphoglycerate dehydrogenase-like enzyme
MPAPVIHLGPEESQELRSAVEDGGGRLGRLEDAAGVVWHGHDPDALPALPRSVRWVQLSSAGVEQWLRAGTIDGERTFTSAAGAYALPVAEHALALMLAADKGLHAFARSRRWEAHGPAEVRTLEGSTVAIVGAGGIGRALISLLQPFGAAILAVTRRGHAVPGAARTYAAGELDEVWPQAHHVVLAAPATDGTRHLVGARELAAMRSDAWLVNVARGSLVDTGALVEALREHAIAGAALDVTDPEPLPDGHPLWELPNALITPHVATPADAERRRFAERVRENVRRFAAGEPLEGVIDPAGGY